MLKFLTTNKALWTTFIATILMTLMFGIIMRVWDFGIIDEMSDPEEIKAHIANMSATQRSVHAVMTATLDVAYPLAYGGFFIGVALRFFGKLGPWLAIPSFLVIPVDLMEGVTQVMALTGNESLLWLKAILTPTKLALYFAGLAVALNGLGIGLKRRMRG